MGCDIHAKIEYRRFSGWRNFAMDVELPRNYVVFGAMVHGHSRTCDGLVGVAPERGYPEDADSWYHLDDERSPDPKHTADHTFSWLMTDEFGKALNVADDFCRQHGWVGVDGEYHAVLAAMRVLEQCGKPARLVFGFDN